MCFYCQLIDGYKEFAKKFKGAKEIGLADMNDNCTIVALTSPIPYLFTASGRGFYTWEESTFSCFPTWSSWVMCGKDINPTYIVTIQTGLVSSINNKFKWDSEMHRFISMQIEADAAWCLATRLGEAYFRKLHTSRVGVMSSINTGTDSDAKHY